MFTTIAVSLASGLAGGALSAAALGWRLRGRVSEMDDVLVGVREVIPALVTRFEVSNAFRELADLEAQRQAAAQRQSAARWTVGVGAGQSGVIPQTVIGVGAPAVMSPYGPGIGAPVEAPPLQSPIAPGVAEMNALMAQQLAAMNERLGQITGAAGFPRQVGGPNGVAVNGGAPGVNRQAAG